MDAAYVFMFIVILVLLAFLIASGAYLLKRAFVTRMLSLLILASFYLSLGVTMIAQILQEIQASISFLFFTIALQFTAYFGLFFSWQTFRLKFKLILIIMLFILAIEGIANIYYAILEDMLATHDIGRIGRTITSALQLSLSAIVQAVLSMRDYKGLKTTHLPPHIIKRYVLFGIAAILVPILDVVDMTGTFLDIAGILKYEFSLAIVLLLTLAYCVLSFLAWVMPAPFKRFIDKGYTISETDLPGILLDRTTSVDQLNSIPTSRSTDIIEYYGDILARMIKVSRGACKGLILLSAQEHEIAGANILLDGRKLVDVFTHDLARKLVELGISNHEEVIDALVSDVKRNQSLFTMSSA